jgi:branched-chain amino acid transport system permease protein
MQLIVDSLIRAAELGLVAMGLTIVYALVRFANIAHVEFATLGAFIALSLAGPSTASIFGAAITGAVAVGLLAVGLQRTVFRRLLRSGSTMAMIGSLALAIILRSAIQTVAGSRPLSFERPLERAVQIGGAFITPLQIWLIVITAVTVLAFVITLFYTKFGRTLRAVAANPDLALASGINTEMVVDAAWLLGAGFAALGGVLVGLDTEVSIDIGFNLLLPVFAAVILGGIGNPMGALAAALLLALAENAVLKVDWGSLVGATSWYLPLSYEAAVGFVVLVITLLLRPQGMFGVATRDA